jgi:hypothetical protein
MFNSTPGTEIDANARAHHQASDGGRNNVFRVDNFHRKISSDQGQRHSDCIGILVYLFVNMIFSENRFPLFGITL